jgi:hypothetical protein
VAAAAQVARGGVQWCNRACRSGRGGVGGGEGLWKKRALVIAGCLLTRSAVSANREYAGSSWCCTLSEQVLLSYK